MIIENSKDLLHLVKNGTTQMEISGGDGLEISIVFNVSTPEGTKKISAIGFLAQDENGNALMS